MRCVEPTIEEFRAALRGVVAQSGLSMRQLSLAFGRDATYVSAILDPRRLQRARPTPADLLRASERTGIPFVELLEKLWGIPAERIADEAAEIGARPPLQGVLAELTAAERAEVVTYANYLILKRRT
jgi:hypothetical protein